MQPCWPVRRVGSAFPSPSRFNKIVRMSDSGNHFSAGSARCLRVRRASNTRSTCAFSRKDLVVVVAVGILLSVVVGVELEKAWEKAGRLCCDCNLKQIGLAFRTWELDNTNPYAMAVSTNFGGSREYLATGETFRHLQVMSNELFTPKILVCPNDSRKPAKAFDQGFSNSSLSYFVGVVSNDAFPQMFLSGDRNLAGGRLLANGILELQTNLVHWGPGMHKNQGNIGLADGSVQGYGSNSLRAALMITGAATNWIALP